MTTVVQITDCHLAGVAGASRHGLDPDETLSRVLNLAAAREPDLIAATGDLTENAEQGAYLRLRALLDRAPAPVVCVPGNHDERRCMEALLPTRRISLAPGVSLDGWRVGFLDSTVPGKPYGFLDETRLAALADDLGRHSQAFKLIFVHHQPVPTQSPWIDAMGLQNGTELLELLDRDKNVRAVAFGHIHHVYEERRGSIQLLSAPATSFQAVPKQQTMVIDKQRGPGLRWFKLYADGRFESGVERLPPKEVS